MALTNQEKEEIFRAASDKFRTQTGADLSSDAEDILRTWGSTTADGKIAFKQRNHKWTSDHFSDAVVDIMKQAHSKANGAPTVTAAHMQAAVDECNC